MAKKTPPAGIKVEIWDIEKLFPHPRQQDLFGDPPERELADLAEDIEKNGLRHPIQSTPDGQVIAGHQRLAALKRLGHKQVEVEVRYDLADKGEEAVERELINDNLIRRHLSPLAKARCLTRLLEIENEKKGPEDPPLGKEEMKKAIADRMNLSPRTLNRYLLVLTAPKTVQQAHELGTISLVEACKVASLPAADLELLEQSLAAGGDVRAEVRAAVRRPPRTDPPHRVVSRLLAGFGNLPPAGPELKAFLQEVDLTKCLLEFEAARGTLAQIVTVCRAQKKAQLAELCGRQ
jgi:ParB-like chromosome segregation protein Spo0J